MEKQFKVERMTNGKGESHLVVITESAIPDIVIGSVVIVNEYVYDLEKYWP